MDNLCYVCGSSCRETAEFKRCVKCGALQTRFSYDPTIYRTKYARNYVAYSETDVNIPLNLCRLGLVSRWLKPADTILDIGCCVGEFIRFAERYYTCAGFEPNREAAKIGRNRCESPIHCELNGSLSTPVKLITMFDVLEHIEEPRAFLSELRSHYLDDRGVIVVTTPNVEVVPQWVDIERMKLWKHYKPQEHLFLYTENALTTMFNQVGMECIYLGNEESDIRPGNPDGDILTFVARKR